MKTKLSTLIGTLFMGGCLFSLVVPAFAQNSIAQEESTSPKIEYKEDDKSNTRGELLNTIVVTGTSVATNLIDAPASVSVIGQEQLQQRAVPDVSEILRTVAGVNVGFGSDGTRGISMRGMGSGYTLILVDGKRVNAGLTTMRHYNGDLDWVPLDAIDRIEVVRGPMSTLYGSDALGGVVNIITKRPEGKWTGSITSEYIAPINSGSGVTRKTKGFIGGAIVPGQLDFMGFGDFGRQTSANPNELGGIQVPRGIDNYDYNGRFTWTPNKDHRFEVEGGAARQKYKPWLEKGEIDTSETEIRRSTGSIRYVGEWGFATSTITGQIEQADNYHNITSRSGVVTGTTSIALTTTSLDGKLSIPLTLMGFKQDLTVGSEYRHEKMVDDENTGKFNSLLGTKGDPTTTMGTAAVFAEDQLQLTDALKMTLGLRVDRHEKFGTHTSPRVYFNYNVSDAFTLKAGWAQAFKAPNLRQLNPHWVQSSRSRGCGAVGGPCEMVGNANLKPETSNSFEVGGNYMHSLFDAGLTYFYNEIDDKITSARQATLVLQNGTKYVQQINVDKARTQGFEGNFTFYLNPAWTWNNTATYLIEAKNLATNQPLSSDPKYSIHTELSWQALDNLALITSMDFYGKQVDYVISETLTAQNVSAYNITNFSVKHDLSKNFMLKAGMNNIFNHQPKSQSNYVENGRSYFVSLTAKF